MSLTPSTIQSIVVPLSVQDTSIVSGSSWWVVRICPDENQYTFVSSRGKSVTDYIITKYCALPDIIEFKIHQCTDIIDQFNLRNFISSTCKVPDHAIQSVSLSLFEDYQNVC